MLKNVLVDVERASRVQRHRAIHVASDHCYGNKKATESSRVYARYAMSG